MTWLGLAHAANDSFFALLASLLHPHAWGVPALAIAGGLLAVHAVRQGLQQGGLQQGGVQREGPELKR